MYKHFFGCVDEKNAKTRAWMSGGEVNVPFMLIFVCFVFLHHILRL